VALQKQELIRQLRESENASRISIAARRSRGLRRLVQIALAAAR
jgi:hypothetical protein